MGIFSFFQKKNPVPRDQFDSLMEDGKFLEAINFFESGQDQNIEPSYALMRGAEWGSIEVVEHFLQKGTQISNGYKTITEVAEFGKSEAPLEEHVKYENLIRFLKGR